MARQTVEVGAIFILSAKARAVIAVDYSVGGTSEAGERTAASEARILASCAHLIGAIIVVALVADTLRCVGVKVTHRRAITSCAGCAEGEAGKAGIGAGIAVGFESTSIAGTGAESSYRSTDWAGSAIQRVRAGEASSKARLATGANSIVIVSSQAWTCGKVGIVSGSCITGEASGCT